MRQRAFIHFNQPVLATFNALARELERDFEQQERRSDHNEFFENEEAFLASFDMPGVSPDDINIELEDDRLIISASRKDPFSKNSESKKYGRVLTMPKNIDIEKINAHYQLGVLKLTLPKHPEIKTKKKITVTEQVVHNN